MTTALIPVAQGFQDEEYVYPYYRLLEAGLKVEVATPSGGDVVGKYGVPARATMSTAEAVDLNVDLLLIPGGFESPDRLRIDAPTIEIARRAMNGPTLVASICHGPWVLVSADTVQGRRCTAYTSVLVDLRNAGAIVIDEAVVVDDDLVTADHYRNNGAFMAATMAELGKRG